MADCFIIIITVIPYIELTYFILWQQVLNTRIAPSSEAPNRDVSQSNSVASAFSRNQVLQPWQYPHMTLCVTPDFRMPHVLLSDAPNDDVCIAHVEPVSGDFKQFLENHPEMDFYDAKRKFKEEQKAKWKVR